MAMAPATMPGSSSSAQMSDGAHDDLGWDDAAMVQRYGDEMLEMVEFAKKETRTAGGGKMRVRDFAERYNTSDIYAVSPVPRAMARILARQPSPCPGRSWPSRISYSVRLDPKAIWFG